MLVQGKALPQGPVETELPLLLLKVSHWESFTGPLVRCRTPCRYSHFPTVAIPKGCHPITVILPNL